MTREPGTIRVATYNVEDFYGAKGGPFNSKPKPTEQVEALAGALKEMDADVVAIQEIQNQEVLDKFVNQQLPGDYPYRRVFSTNDKGEHNLGVLSRYPITDTESHRSRDLGVDSVGKKMQFSRDAVSIDIDVKGVPMRLYDVHFKANPYFQGPQSPEKTQRALDVRNAESHAVQSIILEDMASFPSHNYVVMGDMNARPDEPAIRNLTQTASPPLRDVLEGQDVQSHPVTGGRYDYVMVSPELQQKEVAGSAHVLDSEQTRAASDHLPVYVDFRLSK